MKRKLLIVVVYLLVFAEPAAAIRPDVEKFLISSENYSLVQKVGAGEVEIPDDWDDVVMGYGLFVGYILGVVDVLGETMLKIPEDTPAFEIFDAVNHFIKFNHEYCLEIPALHIVMGAIRGNWPEENGYESGP